MSYSFRKRAATRELLLEGVKQEFANIVKQQPVHERDSAQAVATAEAFLSMVEDPVEGKEFCIDMHGSISYAWDGEKQEYGATLGSTVGVSVHHIQVGA